LLARSKRAWCDISGACTSGAWLDAQNLRLETLSFEPSSPMRSRLYEHPAHSTWIRRSYKLQLAAEVWASKPLLGANSLTDANGALAAVLEVITRNGYHPEPGETRGASEHHREFRVEGLLSRILLGFSPRSKWR
jgi:hypothetical protein